MKPRVALALLLAVVVAAAAALAGGPSAGLARGAPAGAAAPGSTGPWIGVRGNHLIDRRGRVVRLLGVNRSGAEYACQQGWGFFDGPMDAASIRAMRRWRINSVRLPLNETCWLGINGIDPRYGGAPYRRAIHGYVARLERAGLYVVLELEAAAPGGFQASGIPPLPDADHTPAFWRSLASSFRGDRAVLFDLYTEPHDVGWGCVENGCEVEDGRFGAYRAAGMGELVAAVRSTGARQPILVPGVDWARDLSGWLGHLPDDPAHALVASNHTYNFAACYRRCRAALARIARAHPVVTGELGEGDCRDRYIDPYMRWADRHGVSYLAWAWDAHGGWTCRAGPSLITGYRGTPTAFGRGFRDHLLALWRRRGR
ncbi:MAG: cellulase family glycosylhydrolase [Solirubrobacterales bacterium]